MSTLFSEAEADAEVARNISKYQSELIKKERSKMQFIKNQDGKIFQLGEEVTRESIMDQINLKKGELTSLVNQLQEFDQLSGEIPVEDKSQAETPAPEAPETPAEVAPEKTPEAPVQEQPAPTPVEAPAPVVEAPAQPEQPASQPVQIPVVHPEEAPAPEAPAESPQPLVLQ